MSKQIGAAFVQNDEKSTINASKNFNYGFCIIYNLYLKIGFNFYQIQQDFIMGNVLEYCWINLVKNSATRTRRSHPWINHEIRCHTPRDGNLFFGRLHFDSKGNLCLNDQPNYSDYGVEYTFAEANKGEIAPENFKFSVPIEGLEGI